MNNPPIQDPFRFDSNGKLVSIAWIMWLNDLVTSIQLQELFSNISDTSLGGNLQTTIVNNSQDYLFMDAPPFIDTSRAKDDAELLAWLL